MTPLWQRIVSRLLAGRTSEGRRGELIADLSDDLVNQRKRRGRIGSAIWLIREVLSLRRAYEPPTRWLDSLWQDTRYAARGYLRTPLFTISTLLILTVALGATGAMAGLVRAVILRPLPYPAPGELIRIFETRPARGLTQSFSPPNFFDLRDQTSAFSALAAYWSPAITATGANGEPEKVLGAVCSHNLFSLIGVQPELGRGFVAADDVAGAPRTAVLGHGLWLRSFGGDAAILGRQVLLDNTPTEIIGVMPAGFGFPDADTELWVPLRLSRTTPPNPAIPPGRYRQYRILSVIGRLRSDVTVEQANADLAGISRSLTRDFPAADGGLIVHGSLAHDVLVGPVKPVLVVLLGAVGCVLLIACANVGSLFLTRGIGRAREMSIRLALGAQRPRLLRQMLTESVLLSSAGGMAGLVAAWWSFEFLLRLAPAETAHLAHGGIDATIVAVTMAIAVGAGVLFGVAPALQRGRDLQNSLRSFGRGAGSEGRRRLRQALVVTEVAVSLVLLVGAGLLIQSLLRMERVDAGFRPSQVLTIDRIELPRALDTPVASAAFFDSLLTKIRAIPGTTSVGLTLGLPLDPKAHFFVDDTTFSIDDQPVRPVGDRPSAPIHVVGGDYFSTIGVPLVRGRVFEERDRAGASGVIVINEAMARQYWPNGNPVGHRITHDLSIVPGQPSSREIIGVVGDVRHFGLAQPAEPQMFVPHLQMPWPSMAIVLRSSVDGVQIDRSVRESVWSLDRTIPVPATRPLDHVIADALGQPQLRAWLLGGFAAVAVWLAMIGLYSTMAYTVHVRTREMGLRMALGATPRAANRLLVRGGLTLAVIGVVIGLAGALAATRLLSTMLFGVGSLDPATFTAVPAMLVGLAAIACYLPARRVYRIDPIAAINTDG